MDRLSHLAPSKFKDYARSEHELISSLNPFQHPNYLTYFPSRDNYIINYKVVDVSIEEIQMA